MFVETEIDLAPKVYGAIKRIAKAKGKKWEWEPKVGDYCIDKFGGSVVFIYAIDGEELYLSHGLTQYNTYANKKNKLIPLLHWEKLEKIMEKFGYKMYVKFETIGGNHYQCGIRNGTAVLVLEIGKTRQEAVMRAIIRLGEEVEK